ncbi:MAG: glycosyltransferase [Candidatus Rifleibacteriota bacterium]
MSDLRASVVVPVLNSSNSLKNLLESLKLQKFSDKFEVIVVDDGSSEDLEPVVKPFQDSLDLKFIREPENSGPAAARNRGIMAARGEIVVFTDADCIPQADWLKGMIEPFSSSQVAGVKGVYVTRQKDIWAQLAQIEFEERYELLESLPDIDFIDTYSGAYRRELLLKVNGFNSSTYCTCNNEDVDLSFRIKKLGGRFVFTRKAVVEHLHREGWKKYALLKYGRGFWRMRVYADHPEKAVRDSYTPASLKVQLVLVLLLPFSLLSRPLRFWWKTAWLISCFNLLRIAFSRQPFLAILIPLFCLVRAVSLLSGMLASFIRK